MSTAILDIDGVIADARHRLYLIDKAPKNWDAFYDLVDKDPPIPTGRDLARSLERRNRIVYLSGRREGCGPATDLWLYRHGFPAGSIYLRQEGDYRPAAEYKLWVASVDIKDDVTLVVDDDPKVCDAFAAAGYHVLQATWARAEGA